ncbi:MAG: hypothetical protein ACYCVU_04860 [Gammaproteobacteria bacterium]
MNLDNLTQSDLLAEFLTSTQGVTGGSVARALMRVSVTTTPAGRSSRNFANGPWWSSARPNTSVWP